MAFSAERVVGSQQPLQDEMHFNWPQETEVTVKELGVNFLRVYHLKVHSPCSPAYGEQDRYNGTGPVERT